MRWQSAGGAPPHAHKRHRVAEWRRWFSTDQKPPCRSADPPPAEGGACTGVEPVALHEGTAYCVWRVVAIVAEGSLAQDISIKTKTETAKPSMIALFIT